MTWLGVRGAVEPKAFARRRWDMWRYVELLPVQDEANLVSLGEGLTPLVALRGTPARSLGFETRRGRC